MSWDAIAAIGQAVSALALIIVIVQVRHARAETRRSASHHRAETLGELYRTWATDERLIALRIKGENALGVGPPIGEFVAKLMAAGLTQEEVFRLGAEQVAWWNARWPTFADDLSDGQRREMDLGLRSNYGGTGLSGTWYRESKQFLNPEAVRYIDKLLAVPG